jgi:hypothetical protein
VTVREAIALAASAALTDVDGVAGPFRGADGRHGTTVACDRIPGVVCAAAAGGGYDVTLYVIARPVPFAALGRRLAARVTDAVTTAGFGDDLADVRVVVVDVAEPGVTAPDEHGRGGGVPGGAGPT